MDTILWRTRFVVELHAKLSDKEFFIGGYSVRSRSDLRNVQWADHTHMVDVVLVGLNTESVEEAFIAGLDTLNVFLDRASLATYAPAKMLHILSTCPVSVKAGEIFSIATHDLLINIKSPMLTPERIESFEKLPADSVVHEAAHHARKALSEGAAEQHLLHLHIAAERIALSETTDRVKNSCPNCKHKWDGPLASRRSVRALLMGRGVPENDCKDAIEFRSRVAHGGGIRDVAFYDRVTDLAGAVEGAVLSIIAERCGIKALQRRGIVVRLPITIHRAMKNVDGSFNLIETQWKAPVRFPEMGADVSEDGGMVEVGYPMDKGMHPRIDSAAWPV